MTTQPSRIGAALAHYVASLAWRRRESREDRSCGGWITERERTGEMRQRRSGQGARDRLLGATAAEVWRIAARRGARSMRSEAMRRASWVGARGGGG